MKVFWAKTNKWVSLFIRGASMGPPVFAAGGADVGVGGGGGGRGWGEGSVGGGTAGCAGEGGGGRGGGGGTGGTSVEGRGGEGWRRPRRLCIVLRSGMEIQK